MFEEHANRSRTLGVILTLCALWLGTYVGDMAERSQPSPALHQAPGSPIRVAGPPTAVAIADFDRDGNPDIVVAQRNGESLAVLPGNGRGAFSRQQPIDLTGVVRAEHIACGDLDEDGAPDLVVGQHDSSYDLLLLFWRWARWRCAPGAVTPAGFVRAAQPRNRACRPEWRPASRPHRPERGSPPRETGR
jgi:FG-GAP-like repeat